jgi:predicted nucleic acid-binding protein
MIRLFEPLEDDRKAISVLSLLEVRSALRRRELLSDLSAEDATLARTLLATEFAKVKLAPVTRDVVETAERLVDDHFLRTLDALQLGTAIDVRSATGLGLRFVCSDLRLARAALKEGFETWDPAASPSS